MSVATEERVIRVGHSPDPDDAFMFYGLAKDLIPTHGFRFEHILQDIQTLNERATRGELDISAISIHAYAYETLTDRGHLPLLAPMSEIAGRAAAIIGAGHLSAAHGGSGTLMGGAAGVPPAKAVVIGLGVAGTMAARGAMIGRLEALFARERTGDGADGQSPVFESPLFADSAFERLGFGFDRKNVGAPPDFEGDLRSGRPPRRLSPRANCRPLPSRYGRPVRRPAGSRRTGGCRSGWRRRRAVRSGPARGGASRR